MIRIVRRAAADEVVAAFLRGESQSSRFAETVREELHRRRLPPEIVTRPDLRDSAANAARAEILGAYRGWPDTGLFGGLSPTMPWVLAAMTIADVAALRLIRCWPFTDWTGGSLRPGDAAAALAAVGGSDLAASDGILARLRAGDPPPPPILLRGDRTQPTCVLEGNLRIASLMREPALVQGPLFAFVGDAGDLTRWRFF